MEPEIVRGEGSQPVREKKEKEAVENHHPSYPINRVDRNGFSTGMDFCTSAVTQVGKRYFHLP
jgi:hypothetical protein